MGVQCLGSLNSGHFLFFPAPDLPLLAPPWPVSRAPRELLSGENGRIKTSRENGWIKTSRENSCYVSFLRTHHFKFEPMSFQLLKPPNKALTQDSYKVGRNCHRQVRWLRL